MRDARYGRTFSGKFQTLRAHRVILRSKATKDLLVVDVFGKNRFFAFGSG
jgi:hypothetical protein